MSTLIAVYVMSDGMRNKRRLKISMGDDGSLHYRMYGYTSNTGFSLSNLQLKSPLPDMRSDTLDQTMAKIDKALATGLDSILEKEVFAKVAPLEWNPDSHWDIHPDHCISDWQYEVSNDDTRQSYVQWVNSRLEENTL